VASTAVPDAPLSQAPNAKEMVPRPRPFEVVAFPFSHL
jgi:hypothetical protein